MKRLYRIIIGVLFLGIYWLCEYNLTHSESEIYLKSDINELKDTLFFVSVSRSQQQFSFFFALFESPRELFLRIRAIIQLRQSSIVTVGRPSILYFKWIDRQFLSDARKSQSASFSLATVIMVRASTRASIGSPGAKTAESLVSIAHTETNEVYGLCGTTIFLILMCWCSPRSLPVSRLKQRTLTAQ